MRSSHAELAARVRCSSAGSLAPRFFLVYSCGALGRTDQIREGEKGDPNGEQILPAAPWHLVSSRGFQRVDICRDIMSLLGDGSNLVGGFCLSSRSTCTALFLQDLKQKKGKGEGKKKEMHSQFDPCEPPVASLLPFCSHKDPACADYANC